MSSTLLRVVTAITMATAFAPAALDACSCSGTASTCGVFEGASAVFVGTVRSRWQSAITVSEERPGKPPEEHNIPVEHLIFDVEESFKGVEQKIISLRSFHTTCDIRFKDGVSYLVYASEHDGSYQTNVCAGTRPVEFAKESLETLRKSQAPGAKAKVTGTITRRLRLTGPGEHPAAVTGVPMTLCGPGDSLNVRSDDRGAFVFENLSHGHYVLEPELPTGLNLRGWTGTVEFEVGACVDVMLPLRVGMDRPISGTVRHLDGSHVKGSTVAILRVDLPRQDDKLQRERSVLVYPDENGSWKAHDLAPGKYAVGVNIDGAPSSSNLYAPMFYPDSPSIDEAQVFDVVEGSAFTVDLRLKPALKTRRISGVVVDKEGRGASGWIVVRDLDSPGQPTVMLDNLVSDRNGNFAGHIIDGRRYTIAIDAYRDGHTDPMALPPTGDVIGLVLVLKPGRSPLPNP